MNELLTDELERLSEEESFLSWVHVVNFGSVRMPALAKVLELLRISCVKGAIFRLWEQSGCAKCRLGKFALEHNITKVI